MSYTWAGQPFLMSPLASAVSMTVESYVSPKLIYISMFPSPQSPCDAVAAASYLSRRQADVGEELLGVATVRDREDRKGMNNVALKSFTLLSAC
jgi:hypothetical protein